MTEPIVIPPGEGEIIGDTPDRRVEILSDCDELHATWSRFGPGREGAGLHIHRRHTDLFYVLEGELTVRLGIEDEQVTARAGTLVRIPRMVIHGFRNASDANVKYLNFHAPGERFADYMRGLRDGQKVEFDQDEPDVDGVLPASEAAIDGEEFVLEGDGIREALTCNIDALAISDTTAEPNSPSPELHVHRHHVESWYVLEGELGFTLGNREVQAGAGTWLQVPAGMPHTMSFPGPTPARFLTLHTPNSGFGAFLRALDETEDEARALDSSEFDQGPPRRSPSALRNGTFETAA